MRKRPRSSVTTVRTFSISAGLDASTETPGRTAPELSRAEPAMDAWANADAGRRIDTANRNTALRTVRITQPPVRVTTRIGPCGRSLYHNRRGGIVIRSTTRAPAAADSTV